MRGVKGDEQGGWGRVSNSSSDGRGHKTRRGRTIKGWNKGRSGHSLGENARHSWGATDWGGKTRPRGGELEKKENSGEGTRLPEGVGGR